VLRPYILPSNGKTIGAFLSHRCGGYSGAGIGDMPGSGLFRV